MNAFAKFTAATAAAGKGRKKKIVTVMDEETGEETTKTVWVDDDGNEVDDASPALGEKTNASASA